jgi:hypothetical protein
MPVQIPKPRLLQKRSCGVYVATLLLALLTFSARNAQANLVGGYDRSKVARTLKANDFKFRYCYETQLLVKPNLTGVVTAEFSIEAATGRVTESAASGVDPVVATCVADLIKTIRFPAQASAREIVRISYPFHFSRQ